MTPPLSEEDRGRSGSEKEDEPRPPRPLPAAGEEASGRPPRAGPVVWRRGRPEERGTPTTPGPRLRRCREASAPPASRDAPLTPPSPPPPKASATRCGRREQALGPRPTTTAAGPAPPTTHAMRAWIPMDAAPSHQASSRSFMDNRVSH
ncbi:uncharacterized protein [Dermacentor albipictus]|uniref:uncharacterized protein n=1 Tax=Dermacentor albipictus TaxID=60249 RepID=UPI0038FCE1A0